MVEGRPPKPAMSLAAAREVLGVERGSSGDDVKKAYKKLALKHHPDKGGSAEEFMRINEAMEICMDHLYEPASSGGRSGLAAPPRPRPDGAARADWADVKVYWSPGEGFTAYGRPAFPYGAPPALTRLPLAYFRDLLAGRCRERSLSEAAEVDYVVVDARSEEERRATGAFAIGEVKDVALRVEVVALAPEACLDGSGDVALRAGKGCEIPNFKGSYLGRFPLVLADFWTSDHLSERSRP